MNLSLKRMRKLREHEFLAPRLHQALRAKRRFYRTRLKVVEDLLRKPMQKGERK